MPFEELDSQETPMGVISLRRRIEPSRQIDVYEVKLGDEFLMSSLFTVAEIELARLGLAACRGTELEVAVGGLGLGYTAQAVLDDPRVRSMIVIEALDEVIGWHRQGLLPAVVGPTTDARSRLVRGDFFSSAASGEGLDPDQPGRRFDAILVDIDHSPRNVLHPDHAAFYASPGVRHVTELLRPGGVFGLWSDDPPDEDYLGVLRGLFTSVDAHVVSFANFITGGESANTVYVAS